MRTVTHFETDGHYATHTPAQGPVQGGDTALHAAARNPFEALCAKYGMEPEQCDTGRRMARIEADLTALIDHLKALPADGRRQEFVRRLFVLIDTNSEDLLSIDAEYERYLDEAQCVFDWRGPDSLVPF